MLLPIKNNETVIVDEKNICILLGGTITIQKDQTHISVPSKTYFFFKESFEIIAASPFLEGFVIQLNTDFLNNFTDLKTTWPKEIDIFDFIKLKNIEDTRHKIKALLNTNNNPLLSNSYQHILCSELIKNYEDKQKEQPIIVQFSELIEQNIEQNYCAGTYAEMMGIPLKALIREVKQKENKTPCNFITEKVINKAKYKLLNTEDTSQMIAYQLGFEDPYYFIKYFKKNTALTPTQFRKQTIIQN